jgi:hypothetical protein
VHTSTKEENVEVVNSMDFFDMLTQKGIIKKSKPHDNLYKFLLLKQSIPDILFLKKIKKTLKDLSSNEELKDRCDGLVKAKKSEKKSSPSAGPKTHLP